MLFKSAWSYRQRPKIGEWMLKHIPEGIQPTYQGHRMESTTVFINAFGSSLTKAKKARKPKAPHLPCKMKSYY